MKHHLIMITVLILWAAPAFASDKLLEKLARVEKLFDGKLGICVIPDLSAKAICVNDSELFPMQSVKNLLIAVAYWHAADAKKIAFSESTVRAALNEGESGDKAASILLKDLGGKIALQNFLSEKNFSAIRIEEDTVSAEAMAEFLRQVFSTKILQYKSTEKLLLILEKSKTGANLLKAGIPKNWTLGHKSAKAAGQLSDVGIITSPEGRLIPVVVFLADSKWSEEKKARLMSDLARELTVSAK